MIIFLDYCCQSSLICIKKKKKKKKKREEEEEEKKRERERMRGRKRNFLEVHNHFMPQFEPFSNSDNCLQAKNLEYYNIKSRKRKFWLFITTKTLTIIIKENYHLCESFLKICGNNKRD